jgi:hypothetical protein
MKLGDRDWLQGEIRQKNRTFTVLIQAVGMASTCALAGKFLFGGPVVDFIKLCPIFQQFMLIAWLMRR